MNSLKLFFSRPLLLSFVFATFFFAYVNVWIWLYMTRIVLKCSFLFIFIIVILHIFGFFDLCVIGFFFVRFKDLLSMFCWQNFLPFSSNIKTLSLGDIPVSYWEAMTLYNIWMSKWKRVVTESLILW